MRNICRRRKTTNEEKNLYANRNVVEIHEVNWSEAEIPEGNSISLVKY
ncbi:MAG: hypothetical protein AB2L24_23310 [Mangrovibacterium sp.]